MAEKIESANALFVLGALRRVPGRLKQVSRTTAGKLLPPLVPESVLLGEPSEITSPPEGPNNSSGFGQVWPNSAKSGRVRPLLADWGRSSPKSVPRWASSAQLWQTSAPSRWAPAPNLAKLWPKSQNVCRFWNKCRRVRSDAAQIWTILDNSSQMSADMEPNLADVGRTLSQTRRSRLRLGVFLHKFGRARSG